MSAWTSARLVEARSMAVLEPLIAERHGRYVLTDKGTLSRFLQREVGDLLYNDRDGNVVSLELKAEREHTGNLFLETWSNRNLDDARSHAERGSTPGWLLTCRADLLLYHFLDADLLYVLRLLPLKLWAFDKPNRSGVPGRISDFPEVRQAKYAQANDTRGRLVPLAVLRKELAPPPLVLAPERMLAEGAAVAKQKKEGETWASRG